MRAGGGGGGLAVAVAVAVTVMCMLWLCCGWSVGHTVAVVPALRVSDGTIPPQSQWTRNPVPQEADMGNRIPGLPELYGR